MRWHACSRYMSLMQVIKNTGSGGLTMNLIERLHFAGSLGRTFIICVGLAAGLILSAQDVSAESEARLFITQTLPTPGGLVRCSPVSTT